MRKRDVQLGVNPGSHMRAPGDAPSLGRVARMPRNGESNGLSRRRRSASRSRNERASQPWSRLVLMLWSGVLALLALGVIGASMGIWMRNSKRISKRSEPAVSAIQDENRSRSKFPSPSETDALALVRSALENREPARVASLFRLQEASPATVIKALEEIVLSVGPIMEMKWLGSIDANGLLLDGVLVNHGDQERMTQRLVFLTPDQEGKWQVDFDAYARPAIPDLKTIQSNGVRGTIRARVAPDVYFNGPFASDKDWACFALSTIGLERPVLAYCTRDSAQYHALERILRTDVSSALASQVKRATLEIQLEPGGDGRQFRIHRVLAEDWVVGDKIFDERMK